MSTLLRTLINSSQFLKITSLFFGYSLWVILSQQQVTSTTVEVPLCFNNTHGILIQNAPEKITIELKGKRKYLQAVDYKSLAAHINAQELNEETNIVTITEEQLLLPSCITVSMSTPVQINVKKLATTTKQVTDAS